MAAERIPSYRHHKPSDRARVTIDGQDIWLGKWNTPESKAKYKRIISEWLAAGKQLPVSPDDLTIVELVARFWTHAQAFYKPRDGRPTSEADNFKPAMQVLKDSYGDVRAVDFGPRSFRAIQQTMIGKGWCRNYINAQGRRIKAIFRWAAEQELLPGNVYHTLAVVRGLAKHRSEARESEPVRPVPEQYVDAIRPHVSAQVWAMIEFQSLTGARSGEVVILRAADLDTTGKIWSYKPTRHKGEHHEHGRDIRIGPRAQEIIRPFFKPDLAAYIFSPQDAETTRRALLSEQRTTPESCGNVPGSNLKRSPKRAPHQRYTSDSYRQAISRACDVAFPPPAELSRNKVEGTGRKHSLRWETPEEWEKRLGKEGWEKLIAWRESHRWHPHQLRHNMATRVRRDFGIDLAQTMLGHRLGSAVTEIYAAANTAKADEVLAKIG